MRYVVYTLRHTANRTVYAIYDTELGKPVVDGAKLGMNDAPLTTTDRDTARSWAKQWNAGMVAS